MSRALIKFTIDRGERWKARAKAFVPANAIASHALFSTNPIDRNDGALQVFLRHCVFLLSLCHQSIRRSEHEIFLSPCSVSPRYLLFLSLSVSLSQAFPALSDSIVCAARLIILQDVRKFLSRPQSTRCPRVTVLLQLSHSRYSTVTFIERRSCRPCLRLILN